MSGTHVPPSYPNSVQSVSTETGRRKLRVRLRVSRPTLDNYFIKLAELVATRSTCKHRSQGAVLVRGGRILAAGYNGSPPNQPHCIDLECAKDEGMPCRAEGLHGESNAIASAAVMGTSVGGATIYCVYSPCRACCNLLKSAGIVEVKFKDVYDGFLGGPNYLDRLCIKATHLKEVPSD